MFRFILTDLSREQILVAFYSTGKAFNRVGRRNVLTLTVWVEVSVYVPPISSLGVSQRAAGAAGHSGVVHCTSMYFCLN